MPAIQSFKAVEMMNVKEQVLSQQSQVFLEKLESLDLEQIAQKLMHSEQVQG
jgi:hypothetical protein